MNPRMGRILHIIGSIFWFVQMIAVVPILGLNWKCYLIEISLAANVIGHLSGLSAERPSEIIN